MESVDEWLRSSEVAEMFGVHPKTVARWADAGRLPHILSLGDQRRFRRSDVVQLMLERRPLADR